MRKPERMKLGIGILAIAVMIASVVSFAYFWPTSQQLELSGQVQAREVKNGSRFGGRVKDVLVEEGDKVAAGQVLVVFEDVELQSRIAEARATLEQAIAKSSLLEKGAGSAELQAASSQVRQAQENLNMLTKGARPEEITQAKARFQTAEAQYEQAKATLDSSKTLLDEGIISQQKYQEIAQAAAAAKSARDSARAQLNMAQSGGRAEEVSVARSQLMTAQARYQDVLRGAKSEELKISAADVEKARSAIQALEAQLNEVQIKAPFSGFVSVISVGEGELVGPGRPVISLINYDRLWTDVYVPESKLQMLEIGKPVKIKADSYKNTTFEGKVALINPKSEFIPNSGGETSTEESTFRVKVMVENRDETGKFQLFPGMKVTVRFES